MDNSLSPALLYLSANLWCLLAIKEWQQSAGATSAVYCKINQSFHFNLSSNVKSPCYSSFWVFPYVYLSLCKKVKVLLLTNVMIYKISITILGRGADREGKWRTSRKIRPGIEGRRDHQGKIGQWNIIKFSKFNHLIIGLFV